MSNLPPPPATPSKAPPPPASSSVMPPPASSAAPPPASGARPQTANKDFQLSKGRIAGAQKILLYGPGGIGKSSLAALAPNPIFLDVEGGTKELDVNRYGPDQIETFEDLRTMLGSPLLDPYETVIIDTLTKVEEMVGQFVLRTIPHEKGQYVTRLQDYGWGKHLEHIHEAMMLVLQDGDRLVRRGKNVVLITHDLTARVPNPGGEDFLRFEPNLQNPKDSKKNSVRERVIQWVDHAIFVRYDVLTKDGKGKGGGTRTIFTSERPDFIAKVRGDQERKIPSSMPFARGESTIWNLLLSNNAGAPK